MENRIKTKSRGFLACGSGIPATPPSNTMTASPSPRLPTVADFPSSLALAITPPPSSQQPSSILILLHGLGDTHVPFSRLAAQLSLPYTAIISLRGPTPVPALFTGSDAPSFHWGDDILFDQATGEIDMDCGFKASSVVLEEVLVKRILIEKCAYRSRDINFMGFGQGGMAALHVVAKAPTVEYGGVISIGGKLPASSVGSTSKAKTPILVLGGSRSRQVTRSATEKLKEKFNEVEYVKWSKPEDTMPGSREEMMPLMRFWARRLKTRAGVPEDALEIGG
jgi:predicted esterase